MDVMADLRTLITDLHGDTNRQFTELRGDMQQLRGDMQRQLDVTLPQFTELRGDMNRRFEALDQKGDRQFTWVVGIQVALLLGVVGAMVGAYFR